MWSRNAAQQRQATNPDACAAQRAAGQWGVLHYDDLIEAGLSAQAIRTRMARGILHPLYRAVFAWGHHNISTEGRFLAAVKACGLLAVLSHYSAAALRGLVKWDGRPFEITAPTKHRHPRIKAHRSEHIEREIYKGIPVTPKLRTIVDLRRVESDDVVKRARAAARSIVDLGPVATRSPLEDRAYDLVVGLGFELPLSNPPYPLAGRTVYPDLYWPHLRLIVEVDSLEWHDDPLARRDDMERQAELEAAGERVLRFTSAELRNPRRVAARLRGAGVRQR